ncbi:protease inhibitor I42 family protein [Acuticoccus sp. I52.16.1]|uniref:protease inhibitor I42 family protein n=1 Tax=Acuticoccus sp. I52.16.1 TaxID=2928472 RepID=UPI001FCFD4F5|nr:protease inhibitor I42 family protein [Acuticoccus sp. I52.16.1]UOM36701.1 protease inhibitor I42 family protein [Acuticoccus sp. I52.16.1]
MEEVSEGSSVIDAHVGQAVKLALPGAGTTGFRWEAGNCEGLTVERLPALPATTFGGRGRDVFLVTPRRSGDIRLELFLRAPWRHEPAGVREIRFRVR